MTFVREVVERLIRLQDKIAPSAEDLIAEQEGRCSVLRVVGTKERENLLLKIQNGRISFAQPRTQPYHVFKCTKDTFLNLLTGDETVREAVTKKHFVVEDATTGTIDLVECEKLSKAFTRLGGLLRQVLGVA